MINLYKFFTPSVLMFEIVLFTLCISGDNLMSYLPSSTHASHINALVDNLTHGLIGFFSWAVVIDMKVNFKDYMQCSVCYLLASLVDIDHFIAAGSFKLKDALSLPKRPMFHATTLIPLIALAIAILAFIFPEQNFNLLCLLYVTAWLSHHIRDSTRRGLWLPPFGSTSPMPYSMYILSVLSLPLFTRGIWSSMKYSRKQWENVEIV